MNSSGGVQSRRRTVRRRFCTQITTPLHRMHQNNKTQQTGVSARKLAAGMWRFWFSSEGLKGSESWSLDDGSCLELRFGSCTKKYGMEESTKWDCRCSKTYDIDHSRNDIKLLTDKIKPVPAISSLRAELFQAQSKIHELESEVQSSKKKLNHLIKKLGQEKSSQCIEESDKAVEDIKQLKEELRKESRKQQKLEVYCAKAKLSVKQLMYEYKEEKKTRKILEGVCYELAKKLGEEKVQFSEFERELSQMQQELEEERNMLQIAEVWREERVQMKLVDAKIAIENKYAEMNKLMSVLEAFLRSRSTSLDDAEQIIEAVKSVNIRDMKELTYVPSKSDNVYAIIEEIRQFQGETEPSYALSSDGDVCNDYHPNSPVIDGFDVDKLDHSRSIVCYSNGYTENQDSSISLDNGNERLANATVSPRGESVEGGIRCENPLVHPGTSNRANPHVARGMKGLIEWPSSFLKNNLKLRKQIKPQRLN